jgi:hypothetical protein
MLRWIFAKTLSAPSQTQARTVDLPGQHLILSGKTLRMWLLKRNKIRRIVDIQNPTEQTNRPATAVVADKGVPQSDSFAKYAAVDSICQCNTPFNYLFRCFELQCLSRSVV